jgi:hypothetical protein
MALPELIGRRSLRLLCVALLMQATGCTPTTPSPSSPNEAGESCPDQVKDLRDPALSEIVGPGMVAGTGRVIRFLDSSDQAHRGYEVNIDTRIAGLVHNDPVRLIHLADELPGIDPGDEVLVFGVRGPGLLSVSPFGQCPPLVIIQA